MKIKLLFSYVEKVVPPRCKKSREVRYHDGEIELDVVEIQSSEAPVAIRATYESEVYEKPYQMEYRWWGNCLWVNVRNYHGKAHFDKDTKTVTNFLIYPTTIDLRSDSGMTNHDYDICLFNKDNSKAEAIEYLSKWAKNELFIDGIRYRPCGEPHYIVATFGLGRNHGGTACMIDSTNSQNNCDSSVFSLLEREQAIAKATEVAVARGDTNNLPIVPHGPIWEVLIPDAIRIKPLANRIRKYTGFIKTDKEGSRCDFEFEIRADASIEEVENEAREAAFNHIEWSFNPI